jgi:hypothetical protein
MRHRGPFAAVFDAPQALPVSQVTAPARRYRLALVFVISGERFQGKTRGIPMKKMTTLKRSVAALVIAGLSSAGWAQGVTIDFSSSRGTGTAQDRVLMENVRVLTPIANPFSPGSFTTTEVSYNVIFRFDPVTLHLVPETITQSGGTGASTCANADVQVYNSVRGASAPLSGATVTIGSRTATTNSSGVASFTSLPTGVASIGVAASGYVSTTQAATLSCTATNNVAVALSPAAGQTGGLTSGQFRVILTWGQNPSDLDSHMTGPNADGTTRWHVYYSSRTNGGICGLDVDDTSSYGPETITCPATSTTTGLRAGVYRYSVHHFSGSSNIGTSGANVRLEFANGTVYNYTPPASGFTGSNNVWTVFELTVSSTGAISVAPVNTIRTGVSAGSVSRPKEGAVQYGSPEDASLFQNLAK